MNLRIDGLDDELAEAIAARVAQKIGGLLPAPDDSYVEADAPEPLHPDQFYTAKHLAERWGFGERTASVYEIPEAELPRHRVGASRGKTLFYGLDIMRYEGTISEEQHRAFSESKLKILQDPPQESARIRRLRHAVHQDDQQADRPRHGAAPRGDR